MQRTHEKSLQTIKDALLSLAPTGANGFEGLVQATLTKLTGIPFRLASSGLQGGIDGAPAFPSDAVSFEAKRYDSKLSPPEVITKIADFGRNEKSADRLWVLGATTSVGAQLSDKAHQDGDKNALSTLILDWAATPLPLLAVAIVAAEDATLDFILKHGDRNLSRGALRQHFANVRAHSNFDALLQRLLANFNVPQMATKRAVDQNRTWRADAFGGRDKAMERFGQSLTVAATEIPALRAALRETVMQTLKDGKTAVLSGGEGQGKSWLAAQICHTHDGLALFISSENFKNVDLTDLDDLLVKFLIQQTGDVETKALSARWRHRIAAWEQSHPSPPLLVVVDGINQRQSLRWDRLLSALSAKLHDIGGQLVVTTRPQYWKLEVAAGVTCPHDVIPVQNWDRDERDKLLKQYGIDKDWPDAATLEILRNPRLLSVAVDTLPKERSQSWIGLTKDRLLFEHLRKSQAENFEEESFRSLTNRLSDHAKLVLERVRDSTNTPPQHFEEDSANVIDTRFFQMLDGPGQTYELRSDGLTLALGYTLVDQLWQAHQRNHDLTDRMAHLSDPIQAMDRTVDVVFAALMVSALDATRFHPNIFTVLLDNFANLQNLNESRFDEFVEILHHRPDALFTSLKICCLERGGRINYDWLVQAAFEVVNTNEGWEAAQAAIQNWLRCYNADAENQAGRYHRSTDPETAERVQRLKDEIGAVLSSLSLFERSILEQMTPVTGDVDRLYELVLQLLAGRPLAKFADNFVSLGLGLALDRDTRRTRKAFDQLTTFNRTDPDLAKAAFLEAIDPLRQDTTSNSGKWTMVRLQFATGGETEAAEAAKMAEVLREDWNWEPPSPNEWRQMKVADPNASIPTDFAKGLANFNALDSNKILVSMSSSIEDHNFGEFLPFACRFDQIAAVEKGREILSGLLTREGLPMRQLILIGEYLAPLMTRKLALQVLERFSDTNLDGILPENDQNILEMWAYRLIAPYLTAPEQLACIQSGDFGDHFSLDTISTFKPQPADAITAALEAQLHTGNDDAIFCIIAAAQYGGTPITPELENLLLRCLSTQSSLVRAACFELAVQHGLGTVRRAHTQSSWTAADHHGNTYEGWQGASLLIDAAMRGEIALDALLQRIDRRTWFEAAKRLGNIAIGAICGMFLRQLEAAASQVSTLSPPSIDIALNPRDSLPYSMISFEDAKRGQGRFPPEPNMTDLLGGNDDFDEAQRRKHAIADEFFAKIKNTEARHLMRDISLGNLHLLVTEQPPLLSQIASLLEQMNTANFIWFQNLAFGVANLMSHSEPDRCVSLFKRAILTEGFLPLGRGDGLTFEHEALWSATPSDPLKTLWHRRIMSSANDAIIAREVLAAERFGAADFVQTLIHNLAASASPLDQAYAITIAGYSSQSSAHSKLIEGHLNHKGPTGQAAQKAKVEHESYHWAYRHVDALWSAEAAEDVFAKLIIAKTCMDARIPAQTPEDTQWVAYGPLFRTLRTKALKNRNKDREKLLIGMEVPGLIFIT
jgi:hypothetical protein